MKQPVDWYKPLARRAGGKILKIQVDECPVYPVQVTLVAVGCYDDVQWTSAYSKDGFLWRGHEEPHDCDLVNVEEGYRIPPELLAAHPEIFGEPPEEQTEPALDWTKPIKFRSFPSNGSIHVLTTDAHTPLPVWIAYQGPDGEWKCYSRRLDGRCSEGRDDIMDIVQAPERREEVWPIFKPVKEGRPLSTERIGQIRIVFEDDKPVSVALEDAE